MSASEHQVVLESGFFDEVWYRSQYPDVEKGTLDPLTHFMKVGWRLERDPGPRFSVRAYLHCYRDVAEAGVNPLLHYVRHGQAEGRRIYAVGEPLDDIRPATVAQVRTVSARAKVPTALKPVEVPSNRLTRPDSDQRSVPDDSPVEQQLQHTQQLLEHYFARCQQLELRLQAQNSGVK